MATLTRGSQPRLRPAGRLQDRTRSVREICLVGLAPGEPGSGWEPDQERLALIGRGYRVVSRQPGFDSEGGYLHLSVEEPASGSTDR